MDNCYLTSGDITFPSYGDHFGHITVEGTDIDTDVIFGDDTSLQGESIPSIAHAVLLSKPT